MASNEEQLDAAEQNIIHLKRLKELLLAKNKLLKLKHLATESKDSSEINVDHQTKNLITSMLSKSNLNSAIFQIVLDLFVKKNVIHNKSSEEPQLQEFKEKLYKTLQDLNNSSNVIQTLREKIQNLTSNYQEIKDEISLLEHKHKSTIRKNIEIAKKQENNDLVDETRNGQKEQIMSRVEKINLMILIMNGLIHKTRGVDWEGDTELTEIVNMCRNVYKVNELNKIRK